MYPQAAEKGGYAVGAYNVYNLEGVMAVVAAAEAERSPAILQVDIKHYQHSVSYQTMFLKRFLKIPLNLDTL